MIKIDITEIDQLTDGPLYVLIAGAAGVGKSTIVGKYIKTIKMMDLDDVICEVSGGGYDRNNVLEAFEIIAKRIDIIMKRKESFIAMGISAVASSAVERLTNAREKGYTTVVVYVKAPLKQILKQNRDRIERGERGVNLDEEHKIEEMFRGVSNTLRQLKRTDLIDYIVEYDNTRNL